MPGLKIAVNTSCAVAGGAITHLRHVLPAMVPHLGSDQLLVFGTEAARQRIDPPPEARWISAGPTKAGLWSRVWWENTVLPRLLKQEQADVLFHPGNFAVFRSPCPQVLLVHNLAPFLPAIIAGESALQRGRLRLLRRLTLDSLRRTRSTIFISEWGRDLVARVARSSCRVGQVIPFGAEHLAEAEDTEVLQELGLEPGAFVLTVSHLYRYKKIEHLIEAWAALGDRVHDLPLVIVGQPYDSGYAETLERMASRCSSRVVFAGSRDAGDVATLLRSCRVFVFTSQAENLPITLLEAMGCGSVILTNRACSMPEVCGEAACYVDPADAEGYRVQLEKLLWSADTRALHSQRALRRARAYSWERAGAETIEVLRAAVESAA